MAKYVIDLSDEDIRRMEQATGIGIADAEDVEDAIKIVLGAVLPD